MALRFIDGKLFACGTPYRGSSKISENVELPVKSIVCISQGKDNKVEKTTHYASYLKLYEGISCDYELEKIGEKASELIEKIVSEAKIVSFSCTPDEEAVNALYNALY